MLLASVGHRMLTFSDKSQQFKIGLSLRHQTDYKAKRALRGNISLQRNPIYPERRDKDLGGALQQEYCGVCFYCCLSEFFQGGGPGKGGHANQQ